MTLHYFLPRATLIVLAICSIGLLFLPPYSFSADPDPSQPPPVFQPGEIQHGFSEFETLPETYAEDARPDVSDSSQETEPNPYRDPSQKPAGLFYRLEFAEDFEEEEGLRRGHMIVPINPKNVFAPDTRVVYLVFTVHKHYAPYQVFGRLYAEHVDSLNPADMLDEDTMYLATEDESGYLQFFPRSGRWIPGSYQVRIYMGFEANQVNQMGTMGFTVTPDSPSSSRRQNKKTPRQP